MRLVVSEGASPAQKLKCPRLSIIYPLIQSANREQTGSKGVRPRIYSVNSRGVRNCKAPRSAAAPFGQRVRRSCRNLQTDSLGRLA